MSDGYKYKPLYPDCIRLLHVLPESTADNIRCQLIDYSPDLSKRNHFAALSYCWGDPTPVATITIDEQPFGVTQNLFDFLQNRFLHGEHELDHGPASPLSSRGLWVDAICINQSDNEEKSYQVQNMWRVYSCADLVVAWLGKEKAFTASAFRQLRSVDDVMAAHLKTTIYPESNISLPISRAISRMEDFDEDKFTDVWLLCKETYFSRMWVVQEVVCSDSHLVLHSGPNTTPFRSLHDLNLLSGSGPEEGRLFGSNVLGLLRMLGPYQKATRRSILRDISKMLLLQRTRQCYDRRDKLFALRNLPVARLLESECSIPLFVVDYSMSVDETAVATVANFSRLADLLNPGHSSGFTKLYAEYAVGAALGVDFDTDEFRTWGQGTSRRWTGDS